MKTKCESAFVVYVSGVCHKCDKIIYKLLLYSVFNRCIRASMSAVICYSILT